MPAFFQGDCDLRAELNYKVCERWHVDVTYGRCRVDLGGEWYVVFFWGRTYYDADARAAFHDGTLDEDAYDEAEWEAHYECLVEGYREMGYGPEYIE